MIKSKNEGVEMGEHAESVKPQSWAPSYQEECLAIHLHDTFCEKHGKRSGEKFPPDMWCEFFPESGNWAYPVHQRWLRNAREIIAMVIGKPTPVGG